MNKVISGFGVVFVAICVASCAQFTDNNSVIFAPKPLPCAFRFEREDTVLFEDGAFYQNTTFICTVHSSFLAYEKTTLTGGPMVLGGFCVYRPDMKGDDPNTFKVFREDYGCDCEESEIQEKDMPSHFLKYFGELIVNETFDKVEKGVFQGKQCNVYSNNDNTTRYYADDENRLIGRFMQGTVVYLQHERVVNYTSSYIFTEYDGSMKPFGMDGKYCSKESRIPPTVGPICPEVSSSTVATVTKAAVAATILSIVITFIDFF